jgi:dihydrofolate synthase/folylpolyglutamate synthase
MTYPEAIKYLNSFINYENKSKYSYSETFKLERFKSFLKVLGHPQRDLRVIHVAGTKGKGSVCAFIVYILKECGFKVGLYTSPHLSDFRERIRILDRSHVARRTSQDFEGMISQKEICSLIKKLKPKIEKFNKYSKYGDLTFFEVYTALAFSYFKDKKVDFAVLETGLGGRLDATNTCRSLLSIITPISLEHTYLLGKTLKEITYEKASIIKKENKISGCGKRVALSAKQDKAVLKVIEARAKTTGASLIKEGRDFKFSVKGDGLFGYAGLNLKLDNLRINLIGSHQVANASLAVAGIESLQYHGIKVEEGVIRNGLINCVWPARFEIIAKNPLVIIDGAQNGASVKILRKAVKDNFSNKRTWLIFGISQDKELKDTCREIERFGATIILTKSDNPRAAEPKDLLKYFSDNSQILTSSTKEALDLAKKKANRNDVIIVTGSLFVCGEVRTIVKEAKKI